jgi:N-acetyl-alpha-D-muramate 1-phosphate uridylyltransferase
MNHRVMIFAAGRGHRMRPLTDTTPKPLLTVGGKPLIVWQIEALARAGFRDLVINTAWLGAQIEDAIGDGGKYGVTIHYSHEGAREEDALETRGGIVKALSLLGDAPFVTVSSDIFTDYDYATLLMPLQRIAAGEIDAHFVLADNPDFHPEGDFAIRQINGNSFATRTGTAENPRLNYANIACWHPRLFRDLPAEKSRLFPWADPIVAANRVSAAHLSGVWENIGTPAHLDAVNRAFHERNIADVSHQAAARAIALK